MIDIARHRFKPGRILATPCALKQLEVAGQSPAELLERHLRGDWGDLSDADQECNESALIDGSRILSAYSTPTGRGIWIIPEAEDARGRRASTTILLPEEY